MAASRVGGREAGMTGRTGRVDGNPWDTVEVLAGCIGRLRI